MVCVGVVSGAHGVRGLLRVKSFTQVPEAVAAYGPVVDETGARLRLTLAGESGDRLLVRVAGIDDRSAAEALKGRRLYVARAALPAPEEDEFYHADLIGLAAWLRTPDGAARPFGTVAAVHDHGAGALLDVATPDGRSVLVPFTRDGVPVVDLAAGRIEIVPLPGLFDDAETAS